MILYLACYIKKLRSVNKLVELWPSILVSLRQKCHDNRKANRGLTNIFYCFYSLFIKILIFLIQSGVFCIQPSTMVVLMAMVKQLMIRLNWLMNLMTLWMWSKKKRCRKLARCLVRNKFMRMMRIWMQAWQASSFLNFVTLKIDIVFIR